MIINQSITREAEKATPEEEQLIQSLRVKKWGEFAGQKGIKEALSIAITAAKQRKEPLEHVLLHGPPGLGKTTLAHIIAGEMSANIRITSGPAIERSGDLAAILSSLEPHDILFIDEIHRINKTVEEILYSAMEDYVLDVIIGKGPSARTLRITLPPFTIIGATTRIGLLTSPLRDRFGISHRLSFYDAQTLSRIVDHAAQTLNVRIDPGALSKMSQRARGTPRIALKLLKRVRDMAQVKGLTAITEAIVEETCALLEVDPMGLDDADRRLLLALIEKHDGGPVGVETLAATISEDIGTIEDVVEPYLMQIGFLKRTPRGRMVTSSAFKHLGKNIPTHLAQHSLF